MYKYPEANPKTLKNIALELGKNERFYIKVCHLMNLLSLNPPFEEDFASKQKVLEQQTLDVPYLVTYRTWRGSLGMRIEAT